MRNTATQTRQDVVVNTKKNQQLLEKGEAQGYVTYDDMLEVFPNAEQDLDSIEETLSLIHI